MVRKNTAEIWAIRCRERLLSRQGPTLGLHIWFLYDLESFSRSFLKADPLYPQNDSSVKRSICKSGWVKRMPLINLDRRGMTSCHYRMCWSVYQPGQSMVPKFRSVLSPVWVLVCMGAGWQGDHWVQPISSDDRATGRQFPRRTNGSLHQQLLTSVPFSRIKSSCFQQSRFKSPCWAVGGISWWREARAEASSKWSANLSQRRKGWRRNGKEMLECMIKDSYYIHS